MFGFFWGVGWACFGSLPPREVMVTGFHASPRALCVCAVFFQGMTWYGAMKYFVC